MSRAAPAAERRQARNAALVAGHPRWHGIRHPELIPFPPRRFSRFDMLPAVERRRPRPGGRRAERSRDIIAAHPRWRGIRHPERVVFPAAPRTEAALLTYRAAVRVALGHVHESEDLCRRITAVADGIDRRSWPWGAAPARLSPVPPPPRRWRRPRLPAFGGLVGGRRAGHARPIGRLVPH